MNLFDVLFARKLAHSGEFPPVIKRKTGNPIEITDAAAAPLVKCVTQITGYQQGSGTPSPDNIRPIVAYTEGEIEVRGKNILPPYTLTHRNPNLSSNNGVYTLNGTASEYGREVAPNTFYLAPGNYTYRTKGGITSVTTQLRSPDGLTIYANSNGNIVNFTLDALTEIKYRITWEAGSYSDVVLSPQLEKGSTATDYEPYTSTTHTTTYPSAIYRGSEDCVGGTETHDMIAIDLGSLSWVKTSVSPAITRFYTYGLSTLIKAPTSGTQKANIICENFSTESANDLVNGIVDNCIAVGTTGTLIARVSDEDSLTAEQFKTYVTGIKIAFELATPTTSSVTPTNLPIKSLSGYNHIESSTGEMTIDYITDAYQNFVDTTERALPNTRKGGVKAFDIFMTLDEPGVDEQEKEVDEPGKEVDEKEEVKK